MTIQCSDLLTATNIQKIMTNEKHNRIADFQNLHSSARKKTFEIKLLIIETVSAVLAKSSMAQTRSSKEQYNNL